MSTNVVAHIAYGLTVFGVVLITLGLMLIVAMWP